MAATLPFKSVAVALIFSVVLGPVGLLYSSVWGGVLMIMLAIIAASGKMLFPMFVVWVGCCVWSVAAVEKHNRSLLHLTHQE